jgi:hypothetical protein
VVTFTARPLYPGGKSLQYPLDRKVCGHQSQAGRGDDKKILINALPGIEPRSSSP